MFRRLERTTLIPLTLLIATLATGCLLPRAAKVPMPRLEYPAASTTAAEPADCLVVLLPGALDRPGKFAAKGFIDLAREAGLEADLVAVDSHLGYFRNRTFEERFREDVLAPARQRGYRQIWLAGISLGGFGSLLYARRHGESLDGVVALAPFLGDEVVEEIRAAGGVRQWRPEQKSDRLPRDGGRDDAARALWRFLKTYENPPPDLPTLVVGYGTEDRSVVGHRLLAQVLPESHVFTTRGGHDWKAWRELWRQVLAAGWLCSAG